LEERAAVALAVLAELQLVLLEQPTLVAVVVARMVLDQIQPEVLVDQELW
jgi:hypothetical protein